MKERHALDVLYTVVYMYIYQIYVLQIYCNNISAHHAHLKESFILHYSIYNHFKREASPHSYPFTTVLKG